VSGSAKILPGTGRWQPEGLTEGGARLALQWAPSTTSLRAAVPLPVPGRSYA